MVNYESFDHKLAFESFGVRVAIESDDIEMLDFAFGIAAEALLGKYVFIENTCCDVAKRFGLRFFDGLYELYQNGVRTNTAESKAVLFKYYSSMLRLTIAENAVDRVFLHAGTVAWQGKAVIFPARSFKGKTTIVTEMIKAGAEYYSDEYAVIDLAGLVHPFPRPLSIRGLEGEFVETEIPPEFYNAHIGERPVSIGSVVLTEFMEGSNWDPVRISPGQGILETISHTIPLNVNAEMSLKVLSRAFENAIILKGPRGDAKDTAKQLLKFLN